MNYREMLQLIDEELKQAPEDDLVRQNLKLAVFEAYNARYPRDFEERVAVANLALVEAANSWPNSDAKRRGVTFGAYATLRIRWAMANEMIRAVGTTKFTWRKMRELEKTEMELHQKKHRYTTDEEIAKALGWPIENVREIRRIARATDHLSLDAPKRFDDNEEDVELVDTIADDASDVEEAALDAVQAEQTRKKLAGLIEGLTPYLRRALSLRAGIPTPSCETLSVDEVIRIGLKQSTYTSSAIGRLRKDERIDELRTGLGNEGRTRVEVFGDAPSYPKSKARIDFAADVIDSLCIEGEPGMGAAVGE